LFFLKNLPFTLLDITANMKCSTSFISAINKMGGMLPPITPLRGWRSARVRVWIGDKK
jgi:hypothetical protein